MASVCPTAAMLLGPMSGRLRRVLRRYYALPSGGTAIGASRLSCAALRCQAA
jgi:hypothetical protein